MPSDFFVYEWRLMKKTNILIPAVPEEGVEPSRLSAPGLESGVSTVPPFWQNILA